AHRPFRKEAGDRGARRRRHRVSGQADFREGTVSADHQRGGQPAALHQDQDLFRSGSPPQYQLQLHRPRAPQRRQGRRHPADTAPRKSPRAWLSRKRPQMAKSKKDTAAVVTYGDHEVITPENKLRDAVSKAVDGDHDDPLARAEKALAELSPEFANWMDSECD